MSLKVAVIGGGNGGFATASQMALAGHEVHLFELPDFSANIAELKETPVIEVSGALLTGEARLAGVSCDPADGFSDCEIVAECLSLPYACRKKGPRSVGISRSTGTMGLAAFPSERTGEALELFRKVYPGSFGMDNVLRSRCATPISCSIPCRRCSASAASSSAKANSMSTTKPTPPPWNVPSRPWTTRSGPSSARSVSPRHPARRCSRNVMAARGMKCGRGSGASGARGLPTPVADAVISLAGAINGTDYRAEGRTLEFLGLDGLGVDGLRAFLRTGKRPVSKGV